MTHGPINTRRSSVSDTKRRPICKQNARHNDWQQH